MVKPETRCQGLTNCRCEKLYRKGPVAGEEGAPEREEPTPEPYTAPTVPEFTERWKAQDWARRNLADTVSYGEYGIDRANQINELVAEILDAANMKKLDALETIAQSWNSIAQENGILIGERAWANRLNPDAAWQHTMNNFDDALEATIRHEMGHVFHNQNRDRFMPQIMWDAQGVGWEEWKDAYGVTSRARDNWEECVAENFVLFSIGKTEQIHPAMISVFKELTKW